MVNIIPHIANANGKLDKFTTQINDAINKANIYAISKLKAKFDIDIVINDAFVSDIIPETHIGGHTYADDFITLTIDSGCESIKADDLFLTICHELCHAVRWQYNDEWMVSLSDNMFFEGLATAFAIESASDNNVELDYFTKSMKQRSVKDNNKIADCLKDQLDSDSYDFRTIFFNGDSILPRWSGYSLGYYFIKEYINENDKKASDIFMLKYSDFVTFRKKLL